MLADKAILSRNSSKSESLKGRLPQKHLRSSCTEADLYMDDNAANLKSTFTTLLKSVTGYFRVASPNSNKRIRISGPTNFVHFGHAGIDPESGEFNSYANSHGGRLPGENVEAIMCIPAQPASQPLSRPGSKIQSAKCINNPRAKRFNISKPSNPKHITHVSISDSGEYIGLPRDWQTALKESSLRY
ncbi:hypothetical protein K493DRAFT_98490 [Basidiobolus meristosporus CBS 931.73]|uniref:CRIB domain-containing protein n=1 Tax=Basidiobolus meristosporus CBS 931.73 TaxID=1314790 RepID=A0A1Y1YSJ1_9FUNG|nr:hypothetical protein K493DRAFT_98490 [Basidiobolus meristosporus CBS 931.73]|eukprot:ORY00992.1 hypothetical protein K493DRAFT_98490 [Basidiobolus meristosporus CBS 931.73]